jgi:hypothetical protein
VWTKDPTEAEDFEFLQLLSKDSISLKSLEQEARQRQNILRYHVNIGIKLILERPSIFLVSLITLKENPWKEKAKEFEEFFTRQICSQAP